MISAIFLKPFYFPKFNKDLLMPLDEAAYDVTSEENMKKIIGCAVPHTAYMYNMVCYIKMFSLKLIVGCLFYQLIYQFYQLILTS
jgi:hypothetical protein